MVRALGQRDILLQFARLFSEDSIRYLLTGSFAVSYYGIPRATHDIDFVIEIENKGTITIIDVLKKLGKDYLFASDIGSADIQNSTQFNLFHKPTAVKIDFWIVDSNEFLEKYDRRQTVNIENSKITVVSPEDLIIKKLSWCKEVFSERHLRDCIGIWQIQRVKLDKRYLLRKIKEYDLERLYKQMTSQTYA